MMTVHHRRIAASLCLGAMLLGAAACGPTDELNAAVTALQTDVSLGTPPTVAHVPGDSQPPAVPSYPQVPPLSVSGPGPTIPPKSTPTQKTRPVIGPVIKKLACPATSPFAIPPAAVTPLVTNSVATASYKYRVSGTEKVGGKLTSRLSGSQIWSVTRQTPTLPTDNSQFSFTRPSFNHSTITSTIDYMAPPTQENVSVPQTPLNKSITIEAYGGLYLTGVETKSGNTTSTFSPSPPGIELLQVDAQPSATWKSFAADPMSFTAESATGVDLGDAHVNACGTKLDSYEVKITASILGSNDNLTETETYDIGTEYGGLVLAEKQHVTGTTANQIIDQTYSATIDSIKPLLARKAKK